MQGVFCLATSVLFHISWVIQEECSPAAGSDTPQPDNGLPQLLILGFVLQQGKEDAEATQMNCAGLVSWRSRNERKAGAQQVNSTQNCPVETRVIGECVGRSWYCLHLSSRGVSNMVEAIFYRFYWLTSAFVELTTISIDPHSFSGWGCHGNKQISFHEAFHD